LGQNFLFRLFCGHRGAAADSYGRDDKRDDICGQHIESTCLERWLLSQIFWPKTGFFCVMSVYEFWLLWLLVVDTEELRLLGVGGIDRDINC